MLQHHIRRHHRRGGCPRGSAPGRSRRRGQDLSDDVVDHRPRGKVRDHLRAQGQERGSRPHRQPEVLQPLGLEKRRETPGAALLHQGCKQRRGGLAGRRAKRAVGDGELAHTSNVPAGSTVALDCLTDRLDSAPPQVPPPKPTAAEADPDRQTTAPGCPPTLRTVPLRSIDPGETAAHVRVPGSSSPQGRQAAAAGSLPGSPGTRGTRDAGWTPPSPRATSLGGSGARRRTAAPPTRPTQGCAAGFGPRCTDQLTASTRRPAGAAHLPAAGTPPQSLQRYALHAGRPPGQEKRRDPSTGSRPS